MWWLIGLLFTVGFSQASLDEWAKKADGKWGIGEQITVGILWPAILGGEIRKELEVKRGAVND